MSAQGLLPAYLVVGEDKLKRKTVLDRLRGRLNEGLIAFNLDERKASPDLDPTELAVSLSTLPVGDAFRLVIVHDAHLLAKAVSETIVSYLRNPNPDCVLCVVADKLAKNTRLYKALAGVGKSSVIECPVIAPRNLTAHVAKHARALRINIDQAAVRELVSRVGDDTLLLDRQLRTLGAQFPSQRIGVAEVEANVARTAEVKPWEFIDCVAAGDARRAFELLNHMQNPSYVALLTLLTRLVRELVAAKALAARGQSGRLAAELGKQDWQVKSHARDQRRFTMAQLESCLAACATCERELKSGTDDVGAFTRLVITLCRP